MNKVVEDFLDIATPLKKFTDAVDICRADPSTENEENFIEKANVLGTFSAGALNKSIFIFPVVVWNSPKKLNYVHWHVSLGSKTQSKVK